MAKPTREAAPIARPLSKAYLRSFAGWSTAYPPGMSEPNSLRVMENCYITDDEAVAVRPALRSVFPDDVFLDTSLGVSAVGAFEPFYLNDGSKAILFAVRETIATVEYVGFRIGVYDVSSMKYTIIDIDDATQGFDLGSGTTADLAFSGGTTYVRYLQIDNKIFALSDSGERMRMFYVGVDKKAFTLTSIEVPEFTSTDKLGVSEPDPSWVSGAQVTQPTKHGTVSGHDANCLFGLAAGDYTFAFFYTFNSPIGESAPSQLSFYNTQRPWSQWGVNTSDDTKATDQLVTWMPEDVWDTALSQGATSWNCYMLTWSDQDSVPVEGVLLRTVNMEGETYQTAGWTQMTPLLQAQDATRALPQADDVNYTDPPKAAQGIVAGDRLTLVNDITNAAVIRWTSNQQGEYTNLSASKGGGFKTLTSGNLFIPACVKLWQNPQSVDTLTVLCKGVDGYSTSYYMQPASISGNSQSLQIMGFEETTATPGTVSPYGCEVLNNALYHPLDWELMKSTASNYNINHKPMTDEIRPTWTQLVNKQNIVSSQIGTKLYFIVHNPDGAELPEGCMGNEIWLCDTAKEGLWSRWLIPATSLHKIELGDRLYMAVIKPDGIYYLDDRQETDIVNVAGVSTETPIPWRLETNTQGANRAHDAWCHLRQAGIVVGNFRGGLRWGVRGFDRHGRPVEKSKVYRMTETGIDMSERFDAEDYLEVMKDMKEWRFFAESLEDESSFGQVCLVQYRYTPITVNVGYQYGSVETFEYGRTEQQIYTGLSDNGIPQPMMDTRRP